MKYSNEEFAKSLGEGASSYIDLVRYTKPNGSLFLSAVKHSYEQDYESLHKELQILCELKGYPNIVECFGDSLEQGIGCNGDKVHKLLLEYASEGSLSAFMDRYVDRKLPEPMIKNFTRMILEGLVSIHGHGYVHCDLKSDNLLVFPLRDSYQVKICDFGNSLQVGEVPDYWAIDYPFLGTPIYMSPESLRDGVANKTLDLWSLGCLVLEMYTGESPWLGVGINDLTNLLLGRKAPEIPESVPCDARDFIEKCFSRKPEERGSAYDSLFHPFLNREKNLFLLKLKLKLRIRGASKKLKDILEKKPLKLKIFSSKPLQLKIISA